MPQKPLVICCLPDPPIDLGVDSLKINESIVLRTNPDGSTIISKVPTHLTGMFVYQGLPEEANLEDMANNTLGNTSATDMANNTLGNTSAPEAAE